MGWGPFIYYVSTFFGFLEPPPPYIRMFLVKFGFSEKATKFEKIFVVLLTRAWCSVRQQCTCQKVDDEFKKKTWTSHIIQTLMKISQKLAFSDPLPPTSAYVIYEWSLGFAVFDKVQNRHFSAYIFFLYLSTSLYIQRS
jgi:hypothetical protein